MPSLLCDIFSSAPQNLIHEKLAQPQDSNTQPGYSFSTHTPKWFPFFHTGVWTQDVHLEPLHPAVSVMDFFQDRVSRTSCLGWLRTVILLISASWVTRIIGVNHKHRVQNDPLTPQGQVCTPSQHEACIEDGPHILNNPRVGGGGGCPLSSSKESSLPCLMEGTVKPKN
jgi:hypothetical protein